jgi:hypothetical protein
MDKKLFSPNEPSAFGTTAEKHHTFAPFFETFIKTSGGTGPVKLEQPSESCRC